MTTIDTPEGIAYWRLMSAVSLLGLELKTGQNAYGKTSVYKAIRRDFIEGLPSRATMRNKCLAMATFLENISPGGPVMNLAREALQYRLDKEGWVLS